MFRTVCSAVFYFATLLNASNPGTQNDSNTHNSSNNDGINFVSIERLGVPRVPSFNSDYGSDASVSELPASIDYDALHAVYEGYEELDFLRTDMEDIIERLTDGELMVRLLAQNPEFQQAIDTLKTNCARVVRKMGPTKANICQLQAKRSRGEALSNEEAREFVVSMIKQCRRTEQLKNIFDAVVRTVIATRREPVSEV